VVSFFLFIARLISAVADCMSSCLYTHGVTLVRISNAGLKCAARGSLEMQDPKIRHLGTIDNRKKLVKQQSLPTCPYNTVNFGPLAAEIVS